MIFYKRIPAKLLLAHVLLICSLAGKPGPGKIVSSYDLTNKHAVTFTVARELKEISGLAVDKAGRLFAEEDEHGIVFQLDPKTGSVIKRFFLGKGKMVRGDFEDIAIVGGTFYMITSYGKLYTFSEGGDGEHVSYTATALDLPRGCNVEGLCFDPATNSLLIPCKGTSFRARQRPIFSFSLKEQRLDPRPRFELSLRQLKKEFGLEEFRPTGIVRNAETGNFLILSSHMHAVVELSSSGKILDCVKLPGDVHEQPEGIAFLPDGTLLISDEGVKRGILARYPLRK